MMRERLIRVAAKTSKKLLTLTAASVMAFSGLSIAAPLFFTSSAAATSDNNVYINEISSGASSNDWVELYNANNSSIDLTGWTVVDATGNQGTLGSNNISAHGYDVVSFGNRLDNDGDTVSLKNSTSTVLGSVVYGGSGLTAPVSGQSLARLTNGGGDWTSTATPTQGTSNDPAAELSVCSSGCDYTSVASGVSAISADGTVYIASGTYNENVSVTKGVTLVGAQSGVAGSSSRGSETSVTQFNISASNVIVDGFTVAGIHVTAPGSSILAGLNIENNVFSGYSSVALPTYDAGGIAVQNNYFTNPVGSSEAIQIKASSVAGGCSNSQVLNNVFNAATNNGGADINFSCTGSHSTSAVVSGNTSSGNSGGSSLAAFSGVDSDIQVTDNAAVTSGSTVFFFGNVSGAAYVNDNDFSGGSGNAVTIYGGDAGTSDTSNSGTFTITGNDLSGNSSAIKLSAQALNGAGSVVANNNDLSASTSGVAVNNLSSGPVDATHNYWGASPNFGSLIGGTGSANVTHSPYYINSARTHLNTDTVGTVYVDSSYNSSSAGGHEYGWDAFSSIQAGLNAVASGGTVYVNPGTYNESPTLSQAANLIGLDEASTFIDGQINVSAASSSISGFDITNPSGDMGVLINHVGSVSISGNNIHDVSGLGTNDYGVWFQSSGTTDVSTIAISGNTFSNIGSSSNPKTSAAVGIGGSSSQMSIDGLNISNNTISGVNSSTKGTYGILLNLGAASSLAANTGSVSHATIENNDISALSGGWEHAIGLETNTPGAVVSDNVIHDLSLVSDIAAVHFEKNPGAASVNLGGTTFDGKALSNMNSDVIVDTSAPVVPASSELNTYPEYLVGSIYEYAGLNVFNTIQQAVDNVASGGTVNIPAGTFAENITINQPLTLNGYGSGAGGTLIQPASGNALTIAASGADSANPLTIKNLKVATTNSYGVYFNSAVSHVALVNVNASGNNDGIEIHNSAVLNDISLDNVTAANNSIGLRVATTGSVSGLSVTDSSFDSNLNDGWYIAANSASSTNQNNFTNITVSNTSFSHNGNKGIYAEKLDNANFTNVTIDASGTSGSYASGFNINEKYGTYQNISITNSTVTNSGTGDTTNGTGYDIEARDDGSYAANPATLSNVTINGGSISDNQVGLRLGETNKNNAGPTNVSLRGVSFTGNLDLALNNQTQATADISGNWWGNALGPDSSSYSGLVSLSSWCTATDCSATQSALSGTTTLPSGPISSPTVDSTDNTASIIIPSSNDVVATTSTSAGTVEVTIPKGATITANDSTWDGTIQAPSVTSVTLSSDKSVALAIEVGAGNISLTFDKAARLVLPGQAGKLVGFVRNGNFTAITDVCSADSQTAGDSLSAGGNCYINVGSDLIVWTKHFTTFVAYSQPSSQSSSSSSSTSDKAKAPAPTGTTPANGSEGGEVQGQSTSADNGKTSSSNVEAPVANASQPKMAAHEAGGIRWYWWSAIVVAALVVIGVGAYRYAEGTDEN